MNAHMSRIYSLKLFTFVNINKVPPETIPKPIAMAKQKIPNNVPVTDPSNCETAVIIPIVPPFGNPMV